jgi:ABC-type bacteriocin/lantibiotic exporter with double-glycine peptidase domain
MLIQRSLERINQYLQIEQEPKATVDGLPPAHWPSSGNLRAENLCARYSSNGPSVLHNISFDIHGGERVGIGKLHAKLKRDVIFDPFSL